MGKECVGTFRSALDQETISFEKEKKKKKGKKVWESGGEICFDKVHLEPFSLSWSIF